MESDFKKYRLYQKDRKPILTKDDIPYEATDGFRTNVVFPGAMILEDDGQVKIYYGVSDTVECVATADVNDLIALCSEEC